MWLIVRFVLTIVFMVVVLVFVALASATFMSIVLSPFYLMWDFIKRKI